MNLFNEVKKWSTKNFGGQSAVNPLLGMVEELGEYLEAETEEERLDALADATIFLIDFAGRKRLDLEKIPEPKKIESVGIDSLMKASGRLCQAVLKEDQKIKGFGKEHIHTATEVMLTTLWAFSLWNHNVDLAELAQSTFHDVVSKRDFTKSE